MQVYICHSSNFDYHNQLYHPLKSSPLWQKYRFILPHEKNSQPVNSKEIIKNSNLIIAEATYPSTGMGIELGWADDARKKILCVYKAGTKISSSMNIISDNFIEYKTSDELIQQLEQWLNKKFHP